MVKPDTHFEQIPLEMVKKIVEEQMQREIAAERTEGTEEKTLDEDLLRAQEQSRVMSGKISQVEAQEQS
jgi:hypothetical protein